MNLRRPEIGATSLAVLVSLYLLAVTNLTFWSKAWKGFESGAGFLAFGAAALALFTAVMIAVSFRYVAKPIYIFFILSAVPAAYFTDTFGTIINANMLDNALNTNSGESAQFITFRLCLKFALLGVLPSLLIGWLRVDYGAFRRGLKVKLAMLAVLLVVSAGLIVSHSGQVAAAMRRDHRAMMDTLNPFGPVSSAVKVAAAAFANRNVVRAAYGRDAKRGEWIGRAGKPVFTVVVAGEAARAMNFSLNGYARNTNPELERRDVLNFSNVTSCGTETSISLRCMFSGLRRDEFSKSRAMSRESLMDVFQHAGIDTYWWDNDGGSKEVADGVKFQSFFIRVDPAYCRSGICVDDIFLDELDKLIASARTDTVIVLHQAGSHGPAYYLRYPDSFHPFTPDCRLDQLTDCSGEEIVNAYDNTIAYTDRFLASVIDLLNKHGDIVAGTMFYVSDHGESLGENGLYMHGTPYASAPREQTHIPMIAWVSPEYQRMAGFDRACAVRREAAAYSHDNVYHTLLGMMNVETSVYKPELDMFKGCRGG